MALLQSGVESTPRALQIAADAFQEIILRSEDAKNAFPSGLRGKVVEGRIEAVTLAKFGLKALIESCKASGTCDSVKKLFPNGEGHEYVA